MQNIPVTLADHYNDILYILKKEDPPIFLSAKEIESSLIHFSHARKIHKGEKVPDNHRAKSVRSYLKCLQGCADDAIDCYSLLCQISHPAAFSTLYYLIQLDTEGKSYEFNADLDSINIEVILKKYKNVIPILLNFAFNPAFIALKLLNFFPIPDYHTKILAKINLDNIQGWKKIKNKLMDTDGLTKGCT